VRFSELAKLIGDQSLIDRAKEDERLIVLRGKQEITWESALQILSEAGEQFTMTVGMKNHELRLDPRQAVSIKEADLFALANHPLAPGVTGEDLYYVPRIPLDAAEAEAMLQMTTIFTDMADPMAVAAAVNDPKSLIKVYAGYTEAELLRGKPGVRVR
jgi:hypothetical protein